MQANQVTSLIGPSGCGKSTFLRILNRMHELVPSASLAGTVRIDGIDIYRSELLITDIRRRIGMVFQKPNPFPAMTVAENVVAGLKLARPPAVARARRRRSCKTCLERAGLWNEVKNRLGDAGRRALGRAAAAAVHRARARGAARRPADGRAVLGARPDVDPPHRGDDRRAARTGDDRDRHAQHAAGRSGCRSTARSSSRPRASRASSWSRARPRRCSSSPRTSARSTT